MTESVLDMDNWRHEANAVIKDIANHVQSVQVAPQGATNHLVYLNLTTIEHSDFCIELSSRGFRVVGTRHDDKSEAPTNDDYYETPYSLLNRISPMFHQSFKDELIDKLKHLSDTTT